MREGRERDARGTRYAGILGPTLYYYLLSTNASLNRYDVISRDTGYIDVPVFASSSRRVFVSEGGV